MTSNKNIILLKAIITRIKIQSIMKKYLISISILLFSITSFGQRCENFHEKNCFSFGLPYKNSIQSTDFEMWPGQSIEFDIMVLAGYEYNISIAFEKKLGDVSYKITDFNKSKTYYDSDSSSIEEHPYDKQFLVDKSKTLKVIIAAPESLKERAGPSPQRCAGLLVEFTKQLHVGF